MKDEESPSGPVSTREAENEDDGGEAASTTALIKELLTQAVALETYSRHYLAARLDQTKVRVRNAVLILVAAVVGLVVAVGLLVTGGVFIVRGLAGGLAVVFGGRMWLGDLIAGAIVLGGLTGGVLIAVARGRAAALRARADNYERRKERERTRVGRDAEEAAASEGAAHEAA